MEENSISQQKIKQVRINQYITAPKVRLIGVDGSQIGIVGQREALAKAREQALDLVEIAAESQPPVCRIMDYGKYRFEQGKKKNKAKRMEIKEIKMRPTTDVGDYNFKIRKVIGFLQHGNKVKVTVRFRGREMAHQQLAVELLQRVENDLLEYGSIEQRPKLEGRQMIMIVSPGVKKVEKENNAKNEK